MDFTYGLIAGAILFAVSPIYTFPIKSELWCGDSSILACEFHTSKDLLDSYIGIMWEK